MNSILIIGSGGREHAIAWRLRKEGAHVYLSPGNDGIFNDGFLPASCMWENPQSVERFVKSHAIRLVIIGPEEPLDMGLGDFLRSKNIPVIGPNSNAAKLESSKLFAKKMMKLANIPTAEYRCFDVFDAAKHYVEAIDFPIVIKANGLAGGKGSFLPKDKKNAVDILKMLILDKKFGVNSERVIIEKRLYGPEFSAIFLTDGNAILSFPSCRDYKRLKENNEGPNTGGMGAISPAPNMDPSIMEWTKIHVIRPLLEELKKQSIIYSGFLYVGLILTEEGPKVLEFNVRLGDPEAQTLMLALQEDLLPYLFQVAEGSLEKEHNFISVPSACLVLAAKNYAIGNLENGKTIYNLEIVKSQLFYSGVRSENSKLSTAGGRVLSIAAQGKDAMQKCLEDAQKIKFEGVHYRRDLK